ncbi:MAG: hypothetical protein JOY93_12760, partial [Acidobacteriales bacterium]|nr:hypothetical protein [Terriglobales bacterium]
LNLNVLVQTAVKLSQPKMQAGAVQIQTQLANESLPVFGDPNQLLQVCLHVIQNALNAMGGAGGLLTVNTRREQDLVIVEFSDNGPGIEEPDRVFDPFYTTRPLGQGTGLGLSASYGIMREHNGKILCQNRPQGGAMFRLEFPVDLSGKTSSSPELTTAASV